MLPPFRFIHRRAGEPIKEAGSGDPALQTFSSHRIAGACPPRSSSPHSTARDRPSHYGETGRYYVARGPVPRDLSPSHMARDKPSPYGTRNGLFLRCAGACPPRSRPVGETSWSRCNFGTRMSLLPGRKDLPVSMQLVHQMIIIPYSYTFVKKTERLYFAWKICLTFCETLR